MASVTRADATRAAGGTLASLHRLLMIFNHCHDGFVAAACKRALHQIVPDHRVRGQLLTLHQDSRHGHCTEIMQIDFGTQSEVRNLQRFKTSMDTRKEN